MATALFSALWGAAPNAQAQTAGVGDCQPSQYLDRTAAGADRAISWGFTITSDPERCMKVQVGQTVTWNGDLETHPLGSNGGTQPNPIGGNQNGAVTFTSSGTFGFICLNHSSMKGAVFVVAASRPPAQATPATPWWLVLGLAGALATIGFFTLRRRQAVLRPESTT